MQYLYTYEQSRPTDDQIRDEIIAGREYMFITATKALARERRNLIPSDQQSKRDLKPVALFGDVLRTLLLQNHIPFATRGEEKTFLNRALKNVSGGNSSIFELLRKDASSLLRVLYDLGAQGIDLRNGGIPLPKLDLLVDQKLGTYLVQIHNEFHRQLQQEKLALFDCAGRGFLSGGSFRPKTVVILEGFTYFTDLQKFFIDTCIGRDIELFFVVPNRDSQVKGFAVIQRTYKAIPRLVHRSFKTAPLSSKEDLQYVQTNLFSLDYLTYKGSVGTLSINQYPNRDREILACIQQMQKWFADKTYKPSDVVVVMRRSKEFLDRFRDHLAMNPLVYYPEGSVTPVDVELFLPPRLLLLTPVGRFILKLYGIWENGQLRLTMEDMETILASGWLGSRIQDSASQYRAMKQQYFRHCQTRQDWDAALNRLVSNTRPEYERLPSALVNRHNINLWQRAIQMLERVCNQLFVSGQKKIADHIRLLQAELAQLLPKRMRQAEKEVLEQIQRVFTELSEYYSIPITSEEFGEALHALTRGTTEEEADEDDDEVDAQDHVLRIVTPETLDGLSKKAVMYVGADSLHAPVLYAEPWPFYEDKRNEHVEKERYMFLTVVRAANSDLWLSYALKDGDRAFQKSTYIAEIERILQQSVVANSILDQIDATKAKTPPIFPAPPATRRRSYTLNEIAHYALCPLRYRLELLHPEARIYRSEWQLSIVVQGIWLDQIYRMLAALPVGAWPDPRNQPIASKKIDQLFDFFLDAKNSVKKSVRSMFPTFLEPTWIAVERKVDEQLRYHAEKRGIYPTKIFAGEMQEIDVVLANGDSVSVSIQVIHYLKALKITVPLLDFELCHEWLLPGNLQKEDASANGESAGTLMELEGVDVFESQYNAVSWWRKTVQAHVLDDSNASGNPYIDMLIQHREESVEQLERWIDGIVQNRFPKNAGGHCTTCPVRMECLGLKEAE